MDGKTLALVILAGIVVMILSSALTWVCKDFLVPAPACICEPVIRMRAIVDGERCVLALEDCNVYTYCESHIDGDTVEEPAGDTAENKNE